MPFESDAQRRFMFSQHPELAKEFEKATPKGAKLPEHVQKMSAGGPVEQEDKTPALTAALEEAQKNKPQPTPDLKTQVTHPDLNNPASAAKGIFLAKKFADGGVTAGNPSELDPGIKDATATDFLLPYLLGPSAAKAGVEDALPALKGLGEAGEITIGRAAPKMEEAIAGATTKDVIPFKVGDVVPLRSTRPGMPDLAVKYNGPMMKPSPSMSAELNARAAEPMFNLDKEIPTLENSAGKYGVDSTIAKSTLERHGYQVPEGMAHGGYPHVTFLENESFPEVKKDVHLAKEASKTLGNATTGHKENYAEGGTVHKAEGRNKEPAKPKDINMSHEDKLKSIYKAMGIKKYAAGGVAEGGDVDASQLPTPNSTDPTYWDQIKTALSKLGNSPAGTIAGMAMNPVSGIASAVEGAAPAIMKAEAPVVSGVANAMTGGATPTAPAAPTPAPVAAPTVPPAVVPKPVLPAAPGGNPAPQSSELNNLFNQDTSKLTAGVNAEDRNALVNKIGTQQHGLGAVIAQAVSGLGDAIAAKGGREQHSLHDIFSMQKEQRDEALANFDKARQDRIQKLALQTQMGNNSIQKLAAQDAYGVDEHLNTMLGAPAGTAHKDLPLYFQMKSAAVAQQEKDADLYMKAHAQAAGEVDNAVKNASLLSIKPSPAQLEASGAKLADHYYNRAKGNVLVKPSDGGQAQWIPAQNIGKAKQMDPNLQVQP